MKIRTPRMADVVMSEQRSLFVMSVVAPFAFELTKVNCLCFGAYD